MGSLFVEFLSSGKLVGVGTLGRKEEAGVRSVRSVCGMVGVTMEFASLVSALMENESAGTASGWVLADGSVLDDEAEADMGDRGGSEFLQAVMPSWRRQSRAPVSN